MSLASSLPQVSSMEDAASYGLTVRPYLTQLPQYLQAVLLVLKEHSPQDEAFSFYTRSNPLVVGIGIATAFMPIFFLASELSRNYSQVDRCWGILPLVFAVQFAMWNRSATEKDESHSAGRVDLAAGLFVFWGVRITFNYWRKGGYRLGEEDYRMKIIRKNLGIVGSTLMNAFWAATAQVLLLLSLTSPIYVLLLSERVLGPELQPVDMAFGGMILGLIILAGIADQQQWDYQTSKQAFEAQGELRKGFTVAELRRGFATRGLWSYSRHPNFACEQAVWVALYLWSCAITGTLYNWSGAGAVVYLAMFQGSARFSEGISAAKYPEYSRYQRLVGMFLPIPRCQWQDESVNSQTRQSKKDL